MPVDTSMYNTAPPQQQQNPLAMMGQVVGIQNALQQNQLTGQTLAMRQGLGEAYGRATDANGVTNFNQLIGDSARDPRTAWNAGDIIAQAQSNRTATSDADRAQLANVLAHAKAVGEITAGVLGDPDLGKKDLSKKITSALFDVATHNDSVMTPQRAAQLVTQIPTDPQQQLQWVRNHANEAMALGGQAASILGAPQAIDTGPQTNIVRTPAAGGAPAVAGSLTNATGPATRAQLVPVPVPEVQPDGTTLYVTRQVPRSALPGASGVGAGGPPAGGSAVAPAMAPAQPATAPGAPAAAPQARTAAPAYPLAAAPPGVNEAETGVARDSGTALSADRAYAGGYTARNSQAVKALTALRSTNTGPGTEYRQGIVSTALAIPGLGAAGKALGLLDPKSIEAYDEANKLLAKSAADQLSATGAPSDARQSLIQTANASTHISNAAAQNIQIMNLGLDRMKSASVAAFDKTGLPAASYSKWLPTWTKTQDPRAYAVELMTPQDRKELFSGMKADEKARFVQSGETAVDLGFVPHSSAARK